MTNTRPENSTKNPETKDEPETIENDHQGQSQEYGGPKGKEPTRFGDWEKNGRCIDF